MDKVPDNSPHAASAQPSSLWREEVVFLDGDDFFNDLLAHIDRASTDILFQTYIFRDDILGKRVSDALARAAGRGVHTRLLVDGLGGFYWILSHADKLQRQGVEIRVFHPLPFMRIQDRFMLSSFVNNFNRINRRNHTKLSVIDQRTAWVGGLNVSSYQLESFMGNLAWRDTAVRVTGDAISELVQSFGRVWMRSAPLHHKWSLKMFRRSAEVHKGSGLVRSSDRRRRRKSLHFNLIRRILVASERIWITNAYFVPAHSLIRALRRSARSGIDVCIIVPAKSTLFFMPWVASAFYQSLLKSGVRIYEYQPRVLHAKTMIIDSWATIGSSNLNHRSLLHDIELEVVVAKNTSLAILASTFKKDLSESREITLADCQKIPFLVKVVGRMLLFFKYWL